MAEQTMAKKKGLKKGWRIVLGILAGLILLYAVLGVLPRRENYALANPMMKEGALPLLIAHGGGNKEFPDNTLEAFYNAYSVDKNAMMETDVSITRDGVVILSHDTTLDRKTNVTGRIIDWNYSDLMAQKVDFGYTNPTEEMQLSGERVRFTDRDGRQKTPADVEYPDGRGGFLGDDAGGAAGGLPAEPHQCGDKAERRDRHEGHEGGAAPAGTVRCLGPGGAGQLPR